MTIGEAMWQPRFLQYAAEIAPEGRTGVYMGVAQFPWFLTKMIVPLYSGSLIAKYVPAEGFKNPEKLWLISACIAMLSTRAADPRQGLDRQGLQDQGRRLNPPHLLTPANWIGRFLVPDTGC